MIILGINETSHDAAMALIDDDNILFAAHAERYSKQKNDWYNNDEIITDLYSYGTPTVSAYYEKSRLKRLRIKIRGGKGNWKPSWVAPKTKEFKHHYSHAAAGYYTSQFDDAVIVVLDSIGEFNTSTIWTGEGDRISLVEKHNYPFSFGLFYSAFTHLIDLVPNQEEYIMMGMAAYGDPDRYFDKVNSYFPSINNQKYNFHKGITDWGTWDEEDDKFDIAAAVQKVYELRLMEFMRYAKEKTGKEKLVFMGGCALNCSANTKLWDIFDDIWIMPNPGDAGSSLGSALALRGRHIKWSGPYLGYDLGNDYPVEEILDALVNKGIAPVAAGRAEFGPRALGNRSILADPTDIRIKDKVNKIKQRELFRPFAPVIMEEHANEWFDMPKGKPTPYMQYAIKCLKPDLIPAVVHKDGTSRVQTVNKDQHPGLYAVLSEWYKLTGIPVLLNTSLNIKGQPLLNDERDIKLWNEMYNSTIITGSKKQK
jgi:carbamoyltransferase